MELGEDDIKKDITYIRHLGIFTRKINVYMSGLFPNELTVLSKSYIWTHAKNFKWYGKIIML